MFPEQVGVRLFTQQADRHSTFFPQMLQFEFSTCERWAALRKARILISVDLALFDYRMRVSILPDSSIQWQTGLFTLGKPRHRGSVVAYDKCNRKV